MAIGALARAGRVFDKPVWVSSAKSAAEFLWARAFDERTGRLRRHIYRGEPRGEGFLDDYAQLALGLVALGDATGEPIWLTRTGVLASALVKRFVKSDGAVVNTAADATLIVPAVDLQDHDASSGTSAAYALLARLGMNHATPKWPARSSGAWHGRSRPRLKAGQASQPVPRNLRRRCACEGNGARALRT